MQNNHKQPSRAAKARVHKAFDPQALKDICERHESDFGQFAERIDLEPEFYHGQEFQRYYYFKNAGPDVNILAVAHLDTVQSDRQTRITDTASGLLVTSGALDDRLGAYVILDLLPALGIKTDILLTIDEESASSTAREFTPPTDKDYNWIIEFDRGGTDVVMYQYERPEYVTLVENAGARVGIGSYSDIADLDFLECAAFNWGVGYQDYHSTRSHAWLDDTFRMVARFVKFYNANAKTHLPHAYYGRHVELSSNGSEYYYDYNPGDDAPEYLVADCGDLIDINDPTTYVDLEVGYTLCRECATYDVETES